MALTAVANPAVSGPPVVFLDETGAAAYVNSHPGAVILDGSIEPARREAALTFFTNRHAECGPDCVITGDSCLSDTQGY